MNFKPILVSSTANINNHLIPGNFIVNKEDTSLLSLIGGMNSSIKYFSLKNISDAYYLDGSLYYEKEKIIDLRKYPQEYQDAIKVELEKPWNDFKPHEVEKFLLDNGLKSCYNDWTSRWCQDIQALNFEAPDAMDEIEAILNS